LVLISLVIYICHKIISPSISIRFIDYSCGGLEPLRSDAQHVEARDRACVVGGLPLRVIARDSRAISSM
jgi:hypothetical protein